MPDLVRLPEPSPSSSIASPQPSVHTPKITVHTPSIPGGSPSTERPVRQQLLFDNLFLFPSPGPTSITKTAFGFTANTLHDCSPR